MAKFISVYPNRNPESWLKNVLKISLKELQGILKHYHENTSGKKANLLMRTLVFLFFPTKVTVSTVAIRFVYGSYYLLHL